jgi:hypothetical protein
MHNAAEQLVSEYAAPVQEAHFAVAGRDPSGHEPRLITADKFRSLKAKLSSGTVNPEAPPARAPSIQIPDLLLKVRAVRQASNFVDVWAALEAQLAARPLPVEEEKPEIPAAPTPAENGVEALPELSFEAPVSEVLADSIEPLLAEAVAAPAEVINFEVPAQTELVNSTQVLELLPEEEPVEVQELPHDAQPAEYEAVAPDDNQVIIAEPETSAGEPPSDEQALYDSLSERLGPQVSILRKPIVEEDAFASIQLLQPNAPAQADISFPSLASIELEEENATASNLLDASATLETSTEPEPANQISETDPQAGEVARSLLDIMSAPNDAAAAGTRPSGRYVAAARPPHSLASNDCAGRPDLHYGSTSAASRSTPYQG